MTAQMDSGMDLARLILGVLCEKGPSRVPSWSKIISFFREIFRQWTNLNFQWLDANLAFGSREIIFLDLL